ncbi:MAG: ABC transporter substrate-binding protein, partial [Gammaproteobacteria bacterium]
MIPIIRKQKIFKLPVSILCLLLCVACTEQQHGSIRFGLSAAPVTLDPRFATDAMSDRINRLLYTRLVDFDDRFRPVPSLARWEQLDPLHYRFKLGNEGRSFHNGAYLIANDVKATYESLLDPANASPHRITISIIADIEVIDDDTVDFYLHKADPLFPGRLGVGILPGELISSGHPFNRQPIGSGLLKFIDWPSEGDVRLQRISDQQDI